MSGAPASHGSLILLVDDEPVVREAVRRMLEHAGHRVWEAADAAAALDILESRQPVPDLLLTDIVMPGRTGIALAAEAHHRWPTIHVLFMSGFARDFADELSGAVCISKPFGSAELVVAVQSALQPRGER